MEITEEEVVDDLQNSNEFEEDPQTDETHSGAPKTRNEIAQIPVTRKKTADHDTRHKRVNLNAEQIRGQEIIGLKLVESMLKFMSNCNDLDRDINKTVVQKNPEKNIIGW